MLSSRFLVAPVLFVLVSACGGEEVIEDPPPPGPTSHLPDAICTAGSRWVAGGQAFREVTAAWGLTGVLGTRLASVDFDGDGYPDLVVRYASDEASDFTPPDPCCLNGNKRDPSHPPCATGVTCPVQRVFLLRNNGIGGFEDVTVSSGLLTNRSEPNANLGRPAHVFAFGDVDNDGDLDVYTGRADRPDLVQTETSEVMLNDGTGHFVLGPADSQLRVPEGDSPSGASFVDYDRNGALDLFITQNTWDNEPQNDRMLWGDGGGDFFDSTEAAGLVTKPWAGVMDLDAGLSHAVSWGAQACDLNGDGNPELMAASYGRSPNHLWQGSGPESGFVFTNRAVASGYAYDQRVDWSDNESARCYCKLSPAAADCVGVPPPMYIACNSLADAFRWNHATDRNPYRLGGNSGTTVCNDVDNDGDMDLLTTEIVHWDVGSSSDPSELLINSGEPDVRFDRPGNEVTGLTREHTILDWNDGDMTAAVFDFDNDGWSDIYIGSSDYPGAKGLLYHQSSPGLFSQVAFEEGIDHNRSHGIAVADFDRDGDLDVIVGHSRARCGGADDCYPTQQVRMFENLVGQGGNWVQLRLVGAAGTNMAAIGARVRFTGDDGVTQTREVGGGHGHYGIQNDLVVQLGMGTSCHGEVTVRWPDATLTEETFEIVSGYRFVVTQGEGAEVDELTSQLPD